MTAGDPTRLDTRALTEPVSRDQVSQYRRDEKARGAQPGWRLGGRNIVILLALGVGLFMVGNGIFQTVTEISHFSHNPTPFGNRLFFGSALFIPLVVTGICVIGMIALSLTLFRTWGGAKRRYRLHTFAQANGWEYHPTAEPAGYPGMLFQQGHTRRTTDVIRRTDPRLIEFANYTYTTGSGKNQSTHSWGYIAVRLDVPLPHIVLDAKGNNSFLGSTLPGSFSRNQRLSLEGDFDRYFTLYCPREYETDALYLFTPDVMSRMVDSAAELDVEIIDDWMFLYSTQFLVSTSPERWGWLMETVNALTDKLDQWSRWRDDRLAAQNIDARAAAGQGGASPVPPGSLELPRDPAAPITPPPRPVGVAAAGRRLKRQRWGWTTVVTLAIMGWVIYQLIVR